MTYSDIKQCSGSHHQGIVAWVFWIFFALVAEPSLAAQSCDPSCRVSVVDAHPHEILREMASELGIQIGIQGELHQPITVDIEEPSADRLVRKLAAEGGYLVGQMGSTYTLFGRNVPEVTIALSLIHLSASDAAKELSRFEKVEVFVLNDVNAVVVRGSSENVRSASNFIKTIDHERPNLFLELLVVEYFHGDAFTWAYDIVDGTKSKVSGLLVAPGAGAVSGMYEAIADLPKSFRLNLTALVEEEEARVVTNPHIAVRSGEIGRLNFQNELHIEMTNETGNFGTTRRLEKLTAGVLLEVTPNVLDSHLIDLKVNGEVAVFIPAPDGQYAIARQTVTTEVLVKSGETLVIGGLVTKEVSTAEGGIPGLRRIPLLGKLFKSESRREMYIETVIYVTPYINEPSVFLPGNIEKNVEEQFSTP